jgi:hypothetical protein
VEEKKEEEKPAEAPAPEAEPEKKWSIATKLQEKSKLPSGLFLVIKESI